MLELDLEQGSSEWFQARLGMATGSRFKDILTGTGKLSTSADKYMNELLAEMIVGKPIETFQKTEWMERGNELEQEAADMYSFEKDIDVKEVGFVVHKDRIAGASPDRLVGEDGLLEIKCPAPHTHVNYLLKNKIDTAYIPQVQGQLWLTGRKWCDWFSYHPDMPSVCVRVERDEAYIKKLEDAIAGFNLKLQSKKDELERRGLLDAQA